MYLGHKISRNGIEADPQKLEAVRSWTTPTTVKQVRQFLGFAGYYRRFIKDYAKICRPLTDLLRGIPKNVDPRSKKLHERIIWSEDQETSFELIKEKLTTPPVLVFADYRLPFELHCDASMEGLGAVLYQVQEGQRRVIAYASHTLKPAEENYPVHKLEFLALKWSIVEQFHDYLYGNKCHVRTDNTCNPLTYVLTTAKLDATGHRWLQALSVYDISLEYIVQVVKWVMPMLSADYLHRQ